MFSPHLGASLDFLESNRYRKFRSVSFSFQVPLRFSVRAHGAFFDIVFLRAALAVVVSV